MIPPQINPLKPSGPKTLFITGTDTEIGKTHVTCLIARQILAMGHRVAAYKPVCSGAIWKSTEADEPASPVWDDVERLRSAVGPEWPRELICPQRFLAPLAPPIAAKREGRSVNFETMVQGSQKFVGVDMLLIEGAGGWLSPITESATVADLAQQIGAPVIIVARNGLGTINHTLLTIESIRSRGLDIAGVILNEAHPNANDESTETNADEITRRGKIRYLGLVPHGSEDLVHPEGHTVHHDWITLAHTSAMTQRN